MAECLLSKAAMEKIFIKIWWHLERLLQMQEQIQESLLETRQPRQMQGDLSVCVASLEPKLDSLPVNHITSPLFVPPPLEQRPHFFHTPLKWKFHVLMALNLLVGSLISTKFLIFIILRKINDCPLHPSTWVVQPWADTNGCVIITCSLLVPISYMPFNYSLPLLTLKILKENFQINPNHNYQWLSIKVWITFQQNHWTSTPFSVKLFCF